MKSARVMVAAFAVAGIGCAADVDDPEIESAEVAENQKNEAFTGRDNPASVGVTFVYDVSQLPMEGHTTAVPIAGDYWATARDSINYRWNGSNQSPAEKAEQALALPGFAKYVTDNFGIYQSSLRPCAQTSDCADLMDGSSCVTPRTPRAGTTPGSCIPGWWGICHGWAPYAFSEPAPKKAVTRNGVTFHPGDLTALMSFIYGEDLPTKGVAGRCNALSKDFSYDNAGRVRAGECRDNPGSIFIIATNFLGKRKQGFVVDRTIDLEVWNQPVEGYKVTNAVNGALKEITKAEAIGMLGLGFDYSSLLAASDVAKDASKTGSYTATAAGEIVFKLSGSEGDADLFIKKGATTVTRDNADCKSTGGSASEECKITVAANDQVTWLVYGYSAAKAVALQLGTPGSGANYIYNTAAVRFFHVEFDLYWIGEQGPGTTQPDPRGSLRTDHMSFILEATSDGKITGGEWLGESKTKHTDFIWWPTAKPASRLNGLTYALVKSLNDEAAEVGAAPAPETQTVFETTLKYTTTIANQSTSIGVPAGVKKVDFTMTGTGGNADLYVHVGTRPTTTVFTAKSTGTTASEMVSITIPPDGATVWVRARVPATAKTATVSVKVVAKLIR